MPDEPENYFKRLPLPRLLVPLAAVRYARANDEDLLDAFSDAAGQAVVRLDDRSYPIPSRFGDLCETISDEIVLELGTRGRDATGRADG